MIEAFNVFIGLLSLSRDSSKFRRFLSIVGETPYIEIQPDPDNDNCDIVFFMFHLSGFEIVVSKDLIDYVRFFFKMDRGYRPFDGLVFGINPTNDKQSIIELFGIPTTSGESIASENGRYDGEWIRYDKKEYDIHAEFSEDGTIRFLTILDESSC